MSDLIERLRMLKEIAGIEGGCIGDAAADRIAELEAENERLKKIVAATRKFIRDNDAGRITTAYGKMRRAVQEDKA